MHRGSGGFASVVTGIALLAWPSLAPFTLLRLVPAVEAGAVAHLESARHRLGGAARAGRAPGSVAMDVAATSRRRHEALERRRWHGREPRRGAPDPVRFTQPGTTTGVDGRRGRAGVAPVASRTRRRAPGYPTAPTAARRVPEWEDVVSAVSADRGCRATGWSRWPLTPRRQRSGRDIGSVRSSAGGSSPDGAAGRSPPSPSPLVAAVLRPAIAADRPRARRRHRRRRRRRRPRHLADRWADRRGVGPGRRPRLSRPAPADAGARSCPGCSPPLSVLEPTARGARTRRRAVGVVHDRLARTFTARAHRRRAPGSSSSAVTTRPARVEAWVGRLSSLARQGGLVHRLQWVERSLPDGGAEIRRHFAGAARIGVDTAAGRSYAALLDSESRRSPAPRGAPRRDACTPGRAPAPYARPAAGGLAGACTVLLRRGGEPPTADGRGRHRRRTAPRPGVAPHAIHRGFEPDGSLQARARMPGGTSWRAAASPGATGAPVSPWPMALAPSGGACVSTGRGTRPSGWPSGPGPTSARTSSARCCSPRSAGRCRWSWSPSARCERLGGSSRRGPLTSPTPSCAGAAASCRPPGDGARRRSWPSARTELADGHGHYRFTGYVTVSAEDLADLDDACSQVEQAAARSGLELRRCYGDQVARLRLHVAARAAGSSEETGRALVSPAHQVTTRHLGAAYPFASEPGLGGRGVLIGRDLFGGAFAYDPFELYRDGCRHQPEHGRLRPDRPGQERIRQELPVAPGGVRPTGLGRRPQGGVRTAGTGVWARSRSPCAPAATCGSTPSTALATPFPKNAPVGAANCWPRWRPPRWEGPSCRRNAALWTWQWTRRRRRRRRRRPRLRHPRFPTSSRHSSHPTKRPPVGSGPIRRRSRPTEGRLPSSSVDW